MQSARERLTEGSIRNPETGCLEWQGPFDKDGYGQFWYERKNRRAHRVAHEEFVGEIPDGLFVCHACDNPPCILGRHLFVANHSSNMIDSIKKKRHKESRKTHCPQGHSYEEFGKVDRRNKRYCSECNRQRARRSYARRMAHPPRA